MPHVTNEDDNAGCVGLTVVLACRNVTTPEMLVTNPATTRMMTNKPCAGNTKVSDGTALYTSHMTTAINKVTTGGGIFNSRLRLRTTFTMQYL